MSLTADAWTQTAERSPLPHPADRLAARPSLRSLRLVCHFCFHAVAKLWRDVKLSAARQELFSSRFQDTGMCTAAGQTASAPWASTSWPCSCPPLLSVLRSARTGSRAQRDAFNLLCHTPSSSSPRLGLGSLFLLLLLSESRPHPSLPPPRRARACIPGLRNSYVPPY